jgi:transcriptional regulator with XRE-family HTH domain
MLLEMSEWQKRLVEAMQARSVTGADLARRTGFTSQYINSLKNGERGDRLPHETATKIAAALGVSVEWLVHGTGNRERLSDVYPVARPRVPSYGDDDPPSQSGFHEKEIERYPSRAEACALLANAVAREVIVALRSAVPPDPSKDPGREWWIAHAKELARDLRKIHADPVFASRKK